MISKTKFRRRIQFWLVLPWCLLLLLTGVAAIGVRHLNLDAAGNPTDKLNLSSANTFTGLYIPAVTSVGDNGPHSLEAVPTANVTPPAICLVCAQWQGSSHTTITEYVLVEGTDATASYPEGADNQTGQQVYFYGLVRPNDFNATTNAKVWASRR